MTRHSNPFTTPEATALLAKVKAASSQMSHHRVFSQIRTIEDLQKFMSWHVFAVWDFMSLAKRLQLEFTCVSVPWTPPRNIETARLINEIILGEETDIAPENSHLSHFELYLLAMEEIGANTDQIRSFIELITEKISVPEALNIIKAPAAVQKFVMSTVNVATASCIETVLGSFAYGREDAIPEMFQNLLNTWHIDEASAPVFVFYLKRHIALDSDEHGPAAMKMLSDQVGNDSARLNTLLNAALEAIQQRTALWDSLAYEFEHNLTKADTVKTV